MSNDDAPAESSQMSSISTLLKQLNDELTNAAYEIDQADSLTHVAGFSLRHQNCEADSDVADVLQKHTYPALQTPRDAITNAEELVSRIQNATRGLSALATIVGETTP